VADPMTPEWFRDRLYAELTARQTEVAFFSDYYSGDHPLPWLAPQARDEFRRILKMTRSNYMGLVCDATAERVNLEGFRLPGESSADDDSWRIWQENNLDAYSDTAWLESLICGRSFFLVAPNPAKSTSPHIWVEHASQCIVAYEPGTNRRVRRAGLKVFTDDWTGDVNATLYLLVNGRLWLWKWRADKPAQGVTRAPEWRPRRTRDEDWPANGRMDVVPLIEVPNNARLLTGGVSELWDVTDIQDRINKTLADRLITQDFGAFPQKWAVGWSDEDDDGNPNTVDIGRNRLVTSDVSKSDADFGQWDAAPLDPYSAAKREDVKDIASRTRTPAQYLLGEMSNVNGETLKASESGLISKSRQRTRGWSESPEEAIWIARTLAGIPTPNGARMEAIWSDPQYRTEGERTDAAIKRYQANIVPLRQTREDLGYSQAQIALMEDADDDAATRAAGVGVKAVQDAASGGA
jgi:hypothetical protein